MTFVSTKYDGFLGRLADSKTEHAPAIIQQEEKTQPTAEKTLHMPAVTPTNHENSNLTLQLPKKLTPAKCGNPVKIPQVRPEPTVVKPQSDPMIDKIANEIRRNPHQLQGPSRGSTQVPTLAGSIFSKKN